MSIAAEKFKIGAFPMELVKNKASGKLFIVLDDAGGDSFLLITPEGKIKSLERHLFGPLVGADQKDLKWRNQLTPAQMDMYAEYGEKVEFLKFE